VSRTQNQPELPLPGFKVILCILIHLLQWPIASWRAYCRNYDDSKVLTAAKREELFLQMKGDRSLAWATDATSAQLISAQMLAPSRVSLNEIAVQSTLVLLRGLQERGMNITAVRSCSHCWSLVTLGEVSLVVEWEGDCHAKCGT
jgi:ribonuclease HII